MLLLPWFPAPVLLPVLPALPVLPPRPGGLRPHPVLARRQAMLGQPAMPAIEPLYEFFAGGNPIGGPTGETFRGVRASDFPQFEAVLGGGGPLSESATGLAGQPIFLPGIQGEPWP